MQTQKQKNLLMILRKNGECLASEFDNMYFSKSKIKKLNAGVVLFYEKFSTLKEARTISDHCPIWMEYSLN